jgi:hypothetical protein
MVTSALFEKSFLSNGSIWQLLDEVSVSEEDSAASGETGSSTEPQSRHADAYVGDVENLLEGNGKGEDDRVSGCATSKFFPSRGISDK